MLKEYQKPIYTFGRLKLYQQKYYDKNNKNKFNDVNNFIK